MTDEIHVEHLGACRSAVVDSARALLREVAPEIKCGI